MHRSTRLLVALALGVAALAAADGPRHVYCTWTGDPTTTLCVNFQTMAGVREPRVRYAPADRPLDDAAPVATGASHQIAGLADGRWIHHVQLAGLAPGTVYRLQAGGEPVGWSRPLRVRTIPADGSALRFAIGGDQGTTDLAADLVAQVAAGSPHFVVVGGDIAYANGVLDAVHVWDRWFDIYREHLVTPEGLVPPLVLAVGNHEVSWRGTRPEEIAPFYFGFFDQGGPGHVPWFALRFGPNLGVAVLDTGHVVAHGGEQAQWLDRTLTDLADARHRMLIYHVPLYPSVRSQQGGASAAGRQSWLGIIDRHDVEACFEHHDHAFKRTPRLRGNRPDPAGTLYLGDGCFGMHPRAPTKRWYLERVGPIPHFWQVDVTADRVEYRAIDAEGTVFDVYPADADGAAEAAAAYERLGGQ